MGQSNMAGRGETPPFPVVAPRLGDEYRPLTHPGTPHPPAEPLGVNENDPPCVD